MLCIDEPPRAGQTAKRRAPAARRRKPKAVEAIVQKALHQATDAGYERHQIALALVELAGNLVGVWDDDDRKAVVEAMELQLSVLKHGIDAPTLARLRQQRAGLALDPAVLEARCKRLELYDYASGALSPRQRQLFAGELRDMARRLDLATNGEYSYLQL